MNLCLQIYAGAPNIRDYEPGPHSFIHMHDFKSPQDMANYVLAFLEDEGRYSEMFAWKKAGLSPRFQHHLNNCVHLAECRMCEMVHKSRADGPSVVEASSDSRKA